MTRRIAVALLSLGMMAAPARADDSSTERGRVALGFRNARVPTLDLNQIVTTVPIGIRWWFGQHKLGLVATVGGLFRAVPADVLQRYRWPAEQSKVFGEETSLCSWFHDHGGNVAYAEDLVVSHYEGTPAQALRYPDYHRRKMEEA